MYILLKTAVLQKRRFK